MPRGSFAARPPAKLAKTSPRRRPKRLRGGLGLGLSISQRIVLEAGGIIEAEEGARRGCRMVIRLPARQPADPAIDALPSVRSAVAPALRVLLVEDDPLVRSGIVRSLPEIAITCAEDGVAALERLEESGGQAIDAVLCDLSMPRMTAGVPRRDHAPGAAQARRRRRASGVPRGEVKMKAPALLPQTDLTERSAVVRRKSQATSRIVAAATTPTATSQRREIPLARWAR